MKILLMLALLCGLPYCLKAQDPTLGKTKEQIRALIKPNSGIKLSAGESSDTLSMDGGLQTVMYYKNNICYTSKSVMPLKYIDYVTKKMTADSYKKVSDSVWLTSSGKIKVEITVDKNRQQFFVKTSLAGAGNPD
ncbi:hypothetical protein SAMN05216464_10638 [Mucilaginibacter pineti]|uniref:Beta-lactamase-inhibitor-like, PepSY-like n=1 Tax=Mucilaginibacter pineti TaxID=1391627 RepID=A0A1G7CRA6_9SPHI|nr:hypothetical protein [Mucilaginibacter pineti]SDE41196.1 hypothetical protein SAMN05216464_10638 [Mucilaginibacter pineti]